MAIVDADGIGHHSVEPGRRRHLTTVFGRVRVTARKAAAAKGANTYQTRLASGQKQGRKRMATVGSSATPTPLPAAPRRARPAITLTTDDDGGGGAAPARSQSPSG